MRDLAAQAEPDTHDAAEKLYASVPLRGELLVSSNSSARSAQQLRKWKQRSKSEVFEKCQIWREMKWRQVQFELLCAMWTRNFLVSILQFVDFVKKFNPILYSISCRIMY